MMTFRGKRLVNTKLPHGAMWLLDKLAESKEKQGLYENESLAEERDRLPYEIDGVVIKLDDLGARDKLGSTTHHPRWAIAYKFAPRGDETRIEQIAIQIGRTGVLTPSP
jgi:DNA ligase (NAD+)